ncbi:DoxX family protein [Mucilaginibacter limnophilus]|uniref:DoxX family protein n=1 Tax=Mucilaginibacter limnophilus TaxID=1932778 RepID=A0A3S2UMM9_9SPHI|nr:DoxX family protein [Mucilaginibacter limnophilus]RVU02092.1 DoxX family protein [Mucilaginibacter limnophilus]
MRHFLSVVAGKNNRHLATLILRLVIGFGFMAHGWAKLDRGPAGLAHLLMHLHIPFPFEMAWAAILTELIGGAALFIGFYTRIVVFPLIGTMLFAMFSIHLHYGFSSVKTIGLTADGPVFGPPGYEINLVYIAGLAALGLLGSGRWSADAVLHKRPD